MKTDTNKPSLRKQAEKALGKSPEDVEKMSSWEIRKLVHELQVHQVELEIQNEELRKAQTELEHSRDRYSELYDFAPVGYFTLDQNGLILEVNLTGASLLGVERSLLKRMPFGSFIIPDYQDMFYQHRRQIFETKVKQTCELKLQKKDGTPFFAQLESVIVPEAGGNSGQFRTAITDITQLKTAHDQLLHAEKLTALGKLTSSIYHEFGGPIFGIKMVLQQLDESAGLNKENQKLLSLAISENERMSRMLRNLKDLYRPSSDVTAPVDIHRLIGETLEICYKKLQAGKVEVVKDFAADIPLISAVADQIKQVFLNIIANAGEAMAPTGGSLTIGTRLAGEKVLVSFRDTGPGIAKENMDKIFESFFSTKLAEGGTGLGLAVSRGIIKNHGGNILVESTPGKGTAFTVELPAGPAVK